MAFVRVADVDDIAVGQGMLIEVNGLAVAVFNAGGGRFHATSALCPHEDGPLAEGWLEGDVVVCPWHGFDFDLATGECRVNDGLHISVYAVRIVGRDVEIDVPH
jgi:nitrite reductase/ring-hydroxylating ferredoxin subunit